MQTRKLFHARLMPNLGIATTLYGSVLGMLRMEEKRMDAQEMEQTLRKLVRVLLVLLVVAIVGMIAILWQTPIGGAWRQIFVLLFGTRAPMAMNAALWGGGAVLAAVLFLLVRGTRTPKVKTVQAATVRTERGVTVPVAVADTEPPLVLEPLYTRKPREEAVGGKEWAG